MVVVVVVVLVVVVVVVVFVVVTALVLMLIYNLTRFIVWLKCGACVCGFLCVRVCTRVYVYLRACQRTGVHGHSTQSDHVTEPLTGQVLQILWCHVTWVILTWVNRYSNLQIRKV